jgi:SOS response regulatory protein OraA/RecX
MLMTRAGRLLSRRPYSRSELRRRLARFAELDSVEEALNRLEELSLLNDSEYAYNFALCRMKQDGWGPFKVLQSLLRHEVTPALAESAINRVRQDNDEAALLREYVERHCRKIGLPKDLNGIRRLVSHLRRRGFREETIFKGLREGIPEAVWRRYETGD